MKLILSFLMLGTSWFYAQSKYTPREVEETTDIKVVANFIKYNPDHPDIPKFKAKLYHLLNQDLPESHANTTTATTHKVSSGGASAYKKEPINPDTQKAVDLLNHLFGNEGEHSKDAYVLVNNDSECKIIVRMAGRKYYEVEVPAHNSNLVKVDKGQYTFSSYICGAKYYKVKNIQKDTDIRLSYSPK